MSPAARAPATGAVRLIAHRGNARDYPENTLPAFASALAMGLTAMELDVQLSADGVPIVTHDHRLERTTGRAGSVFELSAHEISRIDAHEPERFGNRFAGTRMPLLADVLTLLEGRPAVTLFVEIKSESLAHFGHDQVVSRVVQTLRPARAQCVVISFDLAAVYRARQVAGLPVGWVLEAYDAHSRLKYEAVQPEFLFCDHLKLPPHGPLWRGPWHWAIYEVDDPALARGLGARGVEYIETMAVQAMSQALSVPATGEPAPPEPAATDDAGAAGSAGGA